MTVVLSISLIIGALFVGFNFTEAKTKSGKVAITVVDFRPGEKRVDYTVVKSSTGNTLGHKIFDFLAHEIEADNPFTLTVSFSTKGLHNGDKLYACVDELDFGDAGYCSFDFSYKKGKTFKTSISMASADSSSGNGNNGGGGDNPGDTASVSIASGSSSPNNGQNYVPNKVTVSKGGTVTWTNDDDTLHTVTSGTPEGGNSGTDFDSPYIVAGKAFEHTFDSKGSFDYYCSLHPFMKGKVIVN